MRILIDSSSFIHFLAADEQNILIQFARKLDAKLAVTSTISDEINRVINPQTGKEHLRHSDAYQHWNALTNHITVLQDSDLEQNPDLGQALADLHNADIQSSRKLCERLTDSNNLGEFTAVAYSLALARQGHQVIIVIDDNDGRRLGRLAQTILPKEDIPYQRIRISSTRKIVKESKQEWRKNNRTAEETIVSMQRFGHIPDWERE